MVQVESGFRSPEHIETALTDGKADLVNLVRAQIAEPDYVRKLKSGALDKIRPCLGCNQKCIGRRAQDKWISCVVNLSTGREWTRAPSIKRTSDVRKKIIIVGAGPAGLSLAAQLGHTGNEVQVFERACHPGGLPALYGKPVGKARW